MPVMTDPSVVVKLTPALLEMMKAEGTVAAGLTTEAAAAQLGFKFVKGVGYVKTYTTTATAVEGAITAGEAIAGAGAATGAAESASMTATLVTAADGSTKIMGLGTIALEAGAVVLAGAAGYMAGDAIGELIDSKYPEFFDGLFSTASKFITGDERRLAFLFDSDGHAYMTEKSKKAVEEYVQHQMSLNVDNVVNSENIQLNYKRLSVGDIIAVYNFAGSRYRYHVIKSLTSEAPVYGCIYSIDDGKNFQLSVHSTNNFILEYDMYQGLLYLNNIEWSLLGTYTNNQKNNAYLDKSKPHLTCAGYYTTGADASAIENLQISPSIPLTILPYNYDANKIYLLINQVLYGDNTSNSKIPDIKKYEVPEKPTVTVGNETYVRVPLPEPSDDPTKMPTKIPVLEPEEKPEPEKIVQYIYVPVPTPAPTPKPDDDPSKEPEEVTDTVEPIPIPPRPKPEPTPVPPIPVPPPISSKATGLLHVYNPTNSEINEFGSWLWTTFSSDLIDTLGKLFNNPMEAVIGLHELYCTPITGESATIKAGFLDSGVTSRLVTKRYTEINCGALVVPEHWGNYLDYTPYTKVYCYLPFIGIVELNADDIIGHGVQVLYKIDSYNGSCIAMIITAKTADVEVVKYQFSGNCAVEVPITSGMKSAMQSALIGAGTCAIGAAIGGAAVPVISGMAVNSSVKSGFTNKNTVSHSGSFGSSYGAMGIKKPYIIVKRPIQKVVNGYNDKYGYPAHKMVNIGSCSGYLRCRDFDVQSSTATEDEKKLIENLLKQGVYV